MSNFLKTFGEGFLYFIGLPFILVGLLFYGIGLLFMFIFMSIKGIILFFKGKKYSLILPEDIEAEKILQNAMKAPQPQVQVSPNTQNQVTYNINQYNLNGKGVVPVPQNTNLNSGYYDATNNNNGSINMNHDQPLIDQVPQQNYLSDNSSYNNGGDQNGNQ